MKIPKIWILPLAFAFAFYPAGGLCAAPQIKLMGLIRDPLHKSLAIVALDQKKGFLNVGDMWQGYRLEAIGAKSILLRQGHESMEVFLIDRLIDPSLTSDSYQHSDAGEDAAEANSVSNQGVERIQHSDNPRVREAISADFQPSQGDNAEQQSAGNEEAPAN